MSGVITRRIDQALGRSEAYRCALALLEDVASDPLDLEHVRESLRELRAEAEQIIRDLTS